MAAGHVVPARSQRQHWPRVISSLEITMARVTIQDCLEQIPSHFELTMVAAKRARQLARGAEPKLPWNNHKSTVLALQEIAGGQITAAVLQEMDLPVVKPATGPGPIDPYLDFTE
jgi:DNA-directed RNA polymerase subunit omega